MTPSDALAALLWDCLQDTIRQFIQSQPEYVRLIQISQDTFDALSARVPDEYTDELIAYMKAEHELMRFREQQILRYATTLWAPSHACNETVTTDDE